MAAPLPRLAVCTLALVGAACAAELQPFTLSWGASHDSPASLAQTLATPAGADGRVVVTPEGSFAVSGERIRFFGVNVGAAAAFPPHAEAAAAADQLARFGVNSVRFHHLEAPWAKDAVLPDYAAGTTRRLNPDRFDRLQHFVARLAERGIHTNLNLLVSREFVVGDGIDPSLAALPWKEQQILGVFLPQFLDLQKEYASQFLTPPNPHRGGTPLGRDNAVAFVEILNEHGALQAWHDGILDRLPPAASGPVRVRWNAWLRERHGDTAGLRRAWGVPAPSEPGANLLRNPRFERDGAEWNIERHNGAEATVSSVAEIDGTPALRLSTVRPGGEGWHVQINQGGFPVRAGAVYTLAFRARSSAPHRLSVNLSRADRDWRPLGFVREVDLTPSWQSFSFTFLADASDPHVRVNFSNLGASVQEVWLTDASLREGGALAWASPAAMDAWDNPIVASGAAGSSWTGGARRDWCAFLLELERAYYAAMVAHLRGPCGFEGIIWGTIIANSPPSIQAAMDAVDSHAYWQHPHFPGQAWDVGNWTVGNESMVNHTGGGTLGGIARQRVAGKPHVVTEYQHPFPNPFASEGPLLVAAYGLLQDWDGIWLFDHGTSPGGEPGRIGGFFDQAQDPARMAQTAAAAFAFRRGLVQPAREVELLAFGPDRELDVVANRGSAWSVGDGSHAGLSARAALVRRLSLDLTGRLGAADPRPAPDGAVAIADTGQLRWDNTDPARGFVTAAAPEFRAAVGFVGGRALDLAGIRLSVQNPWAAVALVNLRTEPNRVRMLLTATAAVENTAMRWTDPSRVSVGRDWGSAPTRIEVVTGDLVLPFPAAAVTVWALDGAGRRAAALEIAPAGEAASRVRLGSGPPTVWYTVEIRR